LWVAGDEQLGAESDQLGGESWQVILGSAVTIFDDQVFSINPAMLSQAVKPRVLPGRQQLIYGEKAKLTTRPLRQRTPGRNEQHRSSRNELPSPHRMTPSMASQGQPV
jgi:hypothetical protein